MNTAFQTTHTQSTQPRRVLILMSDQLPDYSWYSWYREYMSSLPKTLPPASPSLTHAATTAVTSFISKPSSFLNTALATDSPISCTLKPADLKAPKSCTASNFRTTQRNILSLSAAGQPDQSRPAIEMNSPTVCCGFCSVGKKLCATSVELCADDLASALRAPPHRRRLTSGRQRSDARAASLMPCRYNIYNICESPTWTSEIYIPQVFLVMGVCTCAGSGWGI